MDRTGVRGAVRRAVAAALVLGAAGASCTSQPATSGTDTQASTGGDSGSSSGSEGTTSSGTSSATTDAPTSSTSSGPGPGSSDTGTTGTTGEATGTGSTSISDTSTSTGEPDLGPCPPGKYLICESFDDTEVGAIPQGWVRHGDPIAVADDAAVSGSHSLKMGPIPVWERRIYHDAAALGSGHWGRVRYKVALPVPDAFVHSTIVALYGKGPTTGDQEVRVVDTVKEDADGWNNDGNGNHFQYLYNVQPNGPEFGKGSDYDWKFDDQWHCAEWHIDGPTQSYDFYIDGAIVEQISIANGPGNYAGSEIPDAFSEVRIGWVNYQESPPGFTAWIDDVALDDERIGCQD
ncbi:hypothetical protein SAMN02745121_05829 [Nannocystis exedens]|uniref:Glycosyl hydrolases family 16 n=2 Tax=Nannocystis exedens TaxID=54 RepID=A0A1I2E032_9BACT|nr:hypothetical protein NAEX_02206 [Nannocystis exedens]SFE86037.1 hypothetical protein SAMN02745121_05829 [Nannocystis exedens]